MSLTHVKGLSELQKMLDTVAPKIEQNILRGALRAGAKPILADAKQNAAVMSGQMRDGLKISTKSKNGTVTASVKAGGKHGYLAGWIEFGTKGHAITGKDGRPLFFGQTFVQSVVHPGSKARPFMRPALDSQAGNAVVAAGNYIKKRLQQKHGLDTSDIVIGEDE